MTTTTGIVYLIGAGPGDPGLITAKGLDCLRRADVVVYDYLANPVLLAEAPEADCFYVGKTRGCHYRPQEEINALLAEQARAGKSVVRLKGGDPYIFGRGGEEARFLKQAQIPFEVVPGVTAAFAAAAYAGIPLTHRDFTTSLGLFTGHVDANKQLDHLDWSSLAKGIGTLVFYMGMTNLPVLTEKLMANGRAADTPVAVVRWATFPRQQVVTGTLADICVKVAEKNVKPPAVIIVGEVVSLREELRWFDNRPLFGKRLLVTRPVGQAAELADALGRLGADPVICPTIEIIPPDDYGGLDAAQDDLGCFDYLVLTSTNAVDAFFQRLDESGQDARALSDLCVVAVGPKTAQTLSGYGIKADLVPADYRAEGVVALLKERVAGKRILYPKAALARDLIPSELTAAGAEVVEPVAYGSAPPADTAERLTEALALGIDLLTFTAASTVNNFVALLDTEQLARARQIPVASIGPLTTRTAEKLGFEVVVEPVASTLETLIDGIVNYFNKLKTEN